MSKRIGDDTIKTPILIVAPDVRVLPLATMPKGQAYLIDGETYCVNGEYPFSRRATGDTTTSLDRRDTPDATA